MIVYTDIHLCAPHEINSDMFNENPANTVLIGDIVDIKNTDKKHCEFAHTMVKALKKMYGERYVFGNHECMMGDLFFIHDKTLYTHGDWFYYSPKKWSEWRNKKHCTMKWWKKPVIKHKEKFRGHGCSMPLEVKKKIVKAAKENDCNRVVLGHKHPREITTFYYDMVEIIVLPRGRHEV